MPAGAVIPVLGYDDVAEAADWLCEAFGFTERWRAGSHRAQLAIGDSAVAITENGPRGSNVMVRVEDVDAHYAAAGEAGAQILGPPTDYLRGTPVHGRRPRRPDVDVLAVDRRRRARGLGRRSRTGAQPLSRCSGWILPAAVT
jgi:hypothetical protein